MIGSNRLYRSEKHELQRITFECQQHDSRQNRHADRTCPGFAKRQSRARRRWQPSQVRADRKQTGTGFITRIDPRGFASLGFNECYIADLDAIAGAGPDYASYQDIIRAGLDQIWIDAGTGNLASAVALDERLSSAGGEHSIVIGSESLADPSDLVALVERLGSERLIFSLDLKAGRPIVSAQAWPSAPLEIAREAIHSGIQRLIVLDLANVGVSSGVGTEQLCRAIRQMDNHIEIIAGGGVRSIDDLQPGGLGLQCGAGRIGFARRKNHRAGTVTVPRRLNGWR